MVVDPRVRPAGDEPAASGPARAVAAELRAGGGPGRLGPRGARRRTTSSRRIASTSSARIRGVDPVDIIRLMRGPHPRRLGPDRPEERQHPHLHARARRRRRCTRPGSRWASRSTASPARATPSATRPSSSTTATARPARATCTRRWSSPRATARPRSSSCRTTSGRSRCRSRRSRARRCIERGEGYGIPSVPIDGNDVLASYAGHPGRARRGPRRRRARARSRRMTYRMGAHTTSDDPTKYRTSDEEELVGRARPDRPHARLPRGPRRVGRVLRRGRCRGAARRRRRPRAHDAARGDPDRSSMFDHVYSEPHPLIDEQRAWLAGYEASFEEGAS